MQSPDGDLIDCVLSQHQLAFDHPLLSGQKPLVVFSALFLQLVFWGWKTFHLNISAYVKSYLNLQDLPERPNGHDPSGMVTENFQLWSLSGESCPEGTIPIRRTTEQDMLRASSVAKYGRKLRRRVRRDSTSNGHEVSSTLVLVSNEKKI